ncbi:MAG: glycerophosphodiester phosphodiesterase [Nocardioidaceae bacterium]
MHRVLVSAHRGGVGRDHALQNTLRGIQHAIHVGADYVEIDVQRCRDGVFVLHHDSDLVAEGARAPIPTMTSDQVRAMRPDVPLLREALAAMQGRIKAHVDLKFGSSRAAYADPESTYEVEACREIVGAMGAAGVIVTCGDRKARAVRAWSRQEAPQMLVGLSVGHSLWQGSPPASLKVLCGDLFPGRRLRHTRANALSAHRLVARLAVARYASRHRLPLLVWTVDARRPLARWMVDPRVWMVTSNYPDRALAARTTSVDLPTVPAR